MGMSLVSCFFLRHSVECLTIESLVSDHGLDLDMGIRIGRTAVPWRTWIPIQPTHGSLGETCELHPVRHLGRFMRKKICTAYQTTCTQTWVSIGRIDARRAGVVADTHRTGTLFWATTTQTRRTVRLNIRT